MNNDAQIIENAEDGTVPVQLLNEDGNLYREIRLQPQFATRVINFIGHRYEKVEGSDKQWIRTGEHPESALSGVIDD